jgi:hypothetical protein
LIDFLSGFYCGGNGAFVRLSDLIFIRDFWENIQKEKPGEKVV